MMRQRALLFLVLCLAIPAQAGLLEDDEARQQIKGLEARVQKLEAAVPKQGDAVKQQTKSMLELQSQIDALNAEIRQLRGQNEDTTHSLQVADKRQKDFYVDLDTRLRHFETEEAAAKAAAKAAAAAAAKTPAPVAESSGPVSEDRAFEAAYGLFKAGKHADAVKAFKDFLKQYPGSIHVPNADYWLGQAQFSTKDFRGALDTYEGLLKAYPDTPKTADVLLEIGRCLIGLKHRAAAHKTLRKIIAKYPASKAAAKAKKLLAATK